MKRITFPRLLAGILAGVLTLLSSAQNFAAEKKPNVLLICIDDMNTQLNCFGNPLVKSPNLDRLAKMGVRFDRAYCNYPVCNPSRTSMLSGRYPEQTQVLGNNTAPRAHVTNLVFLPELFKKHGYYTAGIGKIFHGSFMDTVKWDEWINPHDAEGDDEGGGKRASSDQEENEPTLDHIVNPSTAVASLAGGGDRQDPQPRRRRPEQARGKADKGDATSVPFGWRATDNTDEQEPDGQIAARAVQVLERHKDAPFFLAVGFHKPHVGHIAPRKYFDLYTPANLPLSQEPPLAQQGIPKLALTPKYFPDLSDEQKRAIIWHYYSVTSFMDAQLGKVMAAMDRLKLWDNTIVVFWGDHGWHLGEHGGMWAKVSLMEESARLPLGIVAPGKKSNAVCSRVVESVDICPTLLEFCGLPKPAQLDGRSLVPLLDDPAREWNGMAYTVVTRRGGLGRSVRTEKWTYIEWPDGSSQLYDPQQDSKEYQNLAKDPARSTVVAEMNATLKNVAGKR